MSKREVVLCSPVRSAIGTYNGSLKSTPAVELEAMIRGNVDSLMKLIGALEAAGIELIAEGAASQAGGRGVRLKADFRPARISGVEGAEARFGVRNVA